MADPFKDVPVEHIFHFSDGKKAHNLHSLRDAIAGMDESTFASHVDEQNNDFANWVEFVYKSKPLGDDLRLVSSAQATVEVLDAELGAYGGSKDYVDNEVPDLDLPTPSQKENKEPKGPFEGGDHSQPPQVINTIDGKQTPSVSTHAVHHFIVKEWAWGFVLGLLLGFVLAASLFHFGAL